MKQLLIIAHKAKHSTFYRWLLNKLLWRVIPFNRSHKVTIQSITDTEVQIVLPYIRSNQNHLKGMHACALATLCEYASGIGLMTKLDPSQYRIILAEIKLTYHAQAKSNVTAHFNIDDTQLQATINALTEKGVVVQTYTVQAFDANQKLICTGNITWQLKSWANIKRA